MSSQLSLKKPLVDLSRHYVLKKLSDGWIVRTIEGGDTRFIPRAQLIEMGYLNETDLSSPESPPDTEAIVVPTATDKRKSNPTPMAGRADLDQNWRSTKK
jgi:hypothetical protein